MVHSGCFFLFLFRFIWLCLLGLQTAGKLSEFGLNVVVGALSVFELLDLLLAHCFHFIEELLVEGLLLWVHGLFDLRVLVVGGVTFDVCYLLNLLLVPLQCTELDIL